MAGYVSCANPIAQELSDRVRYVTTIVVQLCPKFEQRLPWTTLFSNPSPSPSLTLTPPKFASFNVLY